MGEVKKNEDQSAENAETEMLKATIATQQQTIADHEATIAAQEKTISEHLATIDEKTEKIIEQSAALKKLKAGQPESVVEEKKSVAKKKAELPKDPVEHEGKKYVFRFASFFYKATRYEAQDIALNEKLITEILADKHQTLLREVH